jgi:hypothetical protein
MILRCRVPRPRAGDEPKEWPSPNSLEPVSTISSPPSVKVRNAAGMVSVQAQCSVDHAMLLMRERAVIQGRTLYQIAVAVLDRTINFGEAALRL